MTTVIYPPSTPADRQAETERVIATVRATIAPAEQAQALRDLAKGADGEPQLDALALYRAAAELDRETIKLLEQWRTCAEDAAAVLLDHIGAKHLDEGIEILAERREQATKHRAETERVITTVHATIALALPADVDKIVAEIESVSARARESVQQSKRIHGELQGALAALRAEIGEAWFVGGADVDACCDDPTPHGRERRTAEEWTELVRELRRSGAEAMRARAAGVCAKRSAEHRRDRSEVHGTAREATTRADEAEGRDERPAYRYARDDRFVPDIERAEDRR